MSTIPGLENAPTRNKKLLEWVDEVATLTQPDRVEWVDGSQEEWDRLTHAPRRPGRPVIKLAWTSRSVLTRSLRARTPSDVARVEDRTYICSLKRGGRGPHEQLAPIRSEMRATLKALFSGSMKRPHDVRRSPSAWARSARRISQLGVEITDSPYVVVNMRIMTRMGQAALDVLGEGRRLRPLPPLGGCTRSPTARPTSRGRATTRSTSSTSPRPARSGPTARATAATRCSARSASRCASPR